MIGGLVGVVCRLRTGDPQCLKVLSQGQYVAATARELRISRS